MNLNFLRSNIIRNSGANLAGAILPAIAAIAATPFLIENLGVANFGILSLQIAILVIIGVNDFGVSRAIVLVCIDKGGFAKSEAREAAAEAGLHLTFTMALAVIVLGCSAVLLASFFTKIQSDLLVSLVLTVLSAAISLVSLPLRAILEVQERFVILNVWRTIASTLLFVSPWLMTSIEASLTYAAIGILVSRILATFAFAIIAKLKTIREIAASYLDFIRNIRLMPADSLHRILIRRGYWIGLGGILSSLIAYGDRFILGVMAAPEQLGFYVVATELSTKLWLVVGAISVAATPRLASTWGGSDNPKFRYIFDRYAIIMGSIALASHLFLVAFARPVMEIWLQNNFHQLMADIVKVLSIGISMNCLSQANFTALNISGREKSGAMVQFFFAPFSIVVLLVGVALYGPIGAAWAVTVRLFIDAFVVKWLLSKGLDSTRVCGVSTLHMILFGGLLVGIYFATK